MVTRYLCLALAAVVGPARGQDGETANQAREAEIERCLLDLREGVIISGKYLPSFEAAKRTALYPAMLA